MKAIGIVVMVLLLLCSTVQAQTDDPGLCFANEPEPWSIFAMTEANYTEVQIPFWAVHAYAAKAESVMLASSSLGIKLPKPMMLAQTSNGGMPWTLDFYYETSAGKGKFQVTKYIMGIRRSRTHMQPRRILMDHESIRNSGYAGVLDVRRSRTD